MQDALDWRRSSVLGSDGSASFDELPDSATIGKRISEESTGKHQEKSVTTDAGKLMEDSRCGGANEDALIDAQKPEWRKEANDRSARGEKWFERPRDCRIEKQNGEQEHDGGALKQRRNTPNDMLSDDVEQDSLKRQEGGGRKHPARKDSGRVREQMTKGVRLFSNQRHEQYPENAGASQYQAEKNS